MACAASGLSPASQGAGQYRPGAAEDSPGRPCRHRGVPMAQLGCKSRWLHPHRCKSCWLQLRRCNSRRRQARRCKSRWVQPCGSHLKRVLQIVFLQSKSTQLSIATGHARSYERVKSKVGRLKVFHQVSVTCSRGKRARHTSGRRRSDAPAGIAWHAATTAAEYGMEVGAATQNKSPARSGHSYRARHAVDQRPQLQFLELRFIGNVCIHQT